MILIESRISQTHLVVLNFCLKSWNSISASYQSLKFDDFLDLTQFFHIWPDSVLIEMNDVNNVIYNNFEYHDQLMKIHRFLTRSL